MKALKLLIASLLLVTQSYAFSKTQKNLLLGIGAGALVVAALNAKDVHVTKVHHTKRVHHVDTYNDRHHHNKYTKKHHRKDVKRYNRHHKRGDHYSRHDRHNHKHYRKHNHRHHQELAYNHGRYNYRY